MLRFKANQYENMPEEEPLQDERRFDGSVSRKSSVLQVLCRVSVEPIITLSLMAMAMQTVVLQNLTQELICQAYFGGSVANCSDYVVTFNGTALVDEIQKVAADYAVYSVAVGTVPTVVLIALLGPCSDRHGRKLPILLPLVGGFLSAVAFIVMLQMENLRPEYTLVALVPAAVTGSQAMVIMSCYSYLSDTTSVEERTLRVALADGALSIGVPLGTVIGGTIFSIWGYQAVSIAQAIAYGLTIVYAAVRIQNQGALQSSSGPCRDFCRLQSGVCANVKVLTKPRRGHFRIYILLMIACELLNGLPQYGEFEVMFIYCKRRFNWDVQTFTYFQTFTTTISAIGMFVLLPILSRLLGIRDSIVGLVGNLGRLVGSILKVFSSTGLILYLGGSMEVLASVGFVVNRAILSKCVASDELGKVFALDGIVQAILPMFAGVVYTQIYKATINYFLGAAFLVSVATTTVVCCIFGWILHSSSGQVNDCATLDEPDVHNC